MSIKLICAALFAGALAADPYDEPNTLPDQQTMVHLFEWKWTDIANECEKFLSKNGYGAVQISPPMEHITLVQDNDLPWYVRYQPVSYQLISRSGTKSQFVDMVNRCNKVNVRIIADVVLNHMVGVGQKKGVNGKGSSGPSDFDGSDGVESFPAVPYGKDDFHDSICHRDITNTDYHCCADNVRRCKLSGLLDLDQSKPYVRSKMIEYLNSLIDSGVAGFRFDASKHMYPADLKAILDGTKNLRSDIFGANKRPFAVHEVIDKGGESVKLDEYVYAGRYTDFNYGGIVTESIRKSRDISDLAWLGPGYGYGNLADNEVLAFIDNHDNQRDADPGVVTYKNGNQYAMAVGFMLAYSYGYPRVMSSYYFTKHDQGPPNLGAGSGYATKSPSFNSDGTCAASSGFVCEHRWPALRRMAMFRKVAHGTKATDSYTGKHQLAFARTKKGYFAVNNGNAPWDITAQTTLPKGAYCELWTGEVQSGHCTGVTINVGADGMAKFTVPAGQFTAFHIGAKL